MRARWAVLVVALMIVTAACTNLQSFPSQQRAAFREGLGRPVVMLGACYRSPKELKPVIDRTYRFDELIEAHKYVDTGRKKGSVVITLEH